MTWPTDVLDHFRGVKKRPDGRGWFASCPTERHPNGDRNPSLCIWLGHNGALILGCWAGCPKAEILRAAHLTWQQLWPPKDKHMNHTPQRAIEQVYNYCDEDGKILYQTVRYHPKDFKQRRPVPGTTGYIWNLDGVKRVPYRLPELLADKKATVLVVEGEKCVEALREIGFCATCNVGGAGKWSKQESIYLQDRHVIILPDCDEPGVHHAQLVAGSLMWWGARSIRMIQLDSELNGMPPRDHGDIADWIKMHNGTPKDQIHQKLRMRLLAHPGWIFR
jgi:hypothetical protein